MQRAIMPASIAEPAANHAHAVWTNIAAILAEADLAADDLVSVTTYVVLDALAELATVMAARDRYLGGRRVASTLVTVPPSHSRPGCSRSLSWRRADSRRSAVAVRVG